MRLLHQHAPAAQHQLVVSTFLQSLSTFYGASCLVCVSELLLAMLPELTSDSFSFPIHAGFKSALVLYETGFKKK